MKIYSQPSTYNYENDKPGVQASDQQNECRVIHFSWGKKNQYNSLIEAALNDLISYVRAYFYKYEEAARAKFFSYANSDEIGKQFDALFWHWYILNYRCYKDVSPIIDFYLAEKLDDLQEKSVEVFHSLKNSYLSLYRVKWVKNNVVALQDLWLGYEFIVERNFGLPTKLITSGSLVLTRLVIVENSTMVTGQTILIQSDQADYLLEEMEFIRLNKQIEDRFIFIKEYGEVLCGLVYDLTQGIKKNRIKAKTLLLDKSEHRAILRQILRKDFTLIERNKSWAKLTYNKIKTSYNRIYFLGSSIMIVGKNVEDMNEIVNCIDLSKVGGLKKFEDGFAFSDEEEAEEILLEITHDRYLNEWLTTPHQDLDDMTPLQAVADARGRVLLDDLLKKLEFIELRAKSKNEYYMPTKAIKTRLKLDKNKFSRELFQPDAISIKVRRHRPYQELSPFVTAYNWYSEDFRDIGIRVFDWLYPEEPKKLAWILFMLNEYSNVYLPKASLPRAIIAALEHTYMELNGKKLKYAHSSKRFGVSSSLISKHAQLLVRHFREYPLDFTTEMAQYPKWSKLNEYEKIKAYEEVWQHLHLFTYATRDSWAENEAISRARFYQVVDDSQKFWTKEMEKTFTEFFKYYNMLDFQNEKKITIANMLWENQAKRFPPYLKTAAFNIMMSHVGVYRIYPEGMSNLLFEDYFTGKTYKVHGNFGLNVHENIVPGMLGITRLLPLGGKMWVNDPMFIVLPDLIDIYEKNLQILLEEFHPFDPTDFQYLKNRGEMAVKSHIITMHEVEQNAVNLMNQPLHIDWFKAGIINYDLVISLLKGNRRLKLIYENEEFTSFVWMRFNHTQFYQWGYIIVTTENILITTPPGKDLSQLIRDIRISLGSEDIVIAFRPWEVSLPRYKLVEDQMVRDLAELFNSNPDLSLALLRQDELENEELEWQQGIFLLKLGALLMDYLDKVKSSIGY